MSSSMSLNVFLLLNLAILPASVGAHGYLSVPKPRVCKEGSCDLEDPWEDPINSNGDDQPESNRQPVNNPAQHYKGESLVCRVKNQDHTDRVLDITAGGTLDLTWVLPADHPGDGGLFISYDGANANTQDMRFFKIAQFPQMRQQNEQKVTVNLPEWLPAGPAVVRWDWYATHNFPYIEFYVNCIDVNIASNSKVQPSAIPSYKIEHGTGTVESYPRYNDEDAWVCGDCDWNEETKLQWPTRAMRGPKCVEGVSGNCCDMSSYVPTERSGAGFPLCKDFGSSGTPTWIGDGSDTNPGGGDSQPAPPASPSTPPSSSPTVPSTSKPPSSGGANNDEDNNGPEVTDGNNGSAILKPSVATWGLLVALTVLRKFS